MSGLLDAVGRTPSAELRRLAPGSRARVLVKLRSLAFVCAAMGHPITLVTSDAFSREKRDHMRALGATVVELPSEGGRTTRELIRRMMSRAAELAAAPDAFYADQFNSPDTAKGYAPLAEEMWEQSLAARQTARNGLTARTLP